MTPSCLNSWMGWKKSFTKVNLFLITKIKMFVVSKKLAFILIILVFTCIFLSLEINPKRINNISNLASDSDIVIIFNSGGWGNTPPEKADDFFPIVKEIQHIFKEWGYSSIVVPYERTEDNIIGRITGAKDFLGFFDTSSDFLAEDVDSLIKNLPNKKIIITGLSNGGAVAIKTYEKLSEEIRGSIFVIAAGIPFWIENDESKNILQLNNDNKDSLAIGNVVELSLAAIKSPFRWIFSKIDRNNKPIEVFYTSGHGYEWSSGAGSAIKLFLEENVRESL